MFHRRDKLRADHARLGRWGEKKGRRYLENLGLRTVTRNFSCRTGELDLVMADRDGTLVFVEIKTRADERFSPAEAAITSRKKQRMIRAARYFMASHDLQDRPYRFDVLAIILGQRGRPEIRHYRRAFVP